jgi:hypothetical protein
MVKVARKRHASLPWSPLKGVGFWMAFALERLLASCMVDTLVSIAMAWTSWAMASAGSGFGMGLGAAPGIGPPPRLSAWFITWYQSFLNVEYRV